MLSIIHFDYLLFISIDLSTVNMAISNLQYQEWAEWVPVMQQTSQEVKKNSKREKEEKEKRQLD